MLRLYISSIPESPVRLIIKGPEHRHAAYSLRATPGTEVEVLDGKGSVVTGAIEKITDSDLICSVADFKKVKRLKPIIDIGLPLLERNSFEAGIKTTTGFNVDYIYPLNTENLSDFNKRRNRFDRDRLERILINGIKQSGNPFMPEIETPGSIRELAFEKYDLIICLDKSGSDPSFRLNTGNNPERILIIVGPEGGLTGNELEFLTGREAELMKLHSYILRTELALAAGLALVSNHFYH